MTEIVEHSEVPPVKKMSRFTCLACPQPGRVGVTCRAYYSREMVNGKLKRDINFIDLSDELSDAARIHSFLFFKSNGQGLTDIKDRIRLQRWISLEISTKLHISIVRWFQ